MWSADPLEKMDEKLKTENMQKEHVYVIFRQQSEQSRQAGVENGAMLTTYFFQIYFRMHHFVVKFSKLSSPQAASWH